MKNRRAKRTQVVLIALFTSLPFHALLQYSFEKFVTFTRNSLISKKKYIYINIADA